MNNPVETAQPMAKAVRPHATLKALRRRLRTIGSCRQPDVESIHQLRVGARRSRATIKFYEAVIGARRAQRLDRRLKTLLAAAGTVRDADVLHAEMKSLGLNDQTAGASSLYDDLRTMRAHSLKSLRHIAARRRLRKLLKSAGKKLEAFAIEGLDTVGLERECSVVAQAASRLWDELQTASPGQIDRLHLVRIRTKKLRYICELCVGLPAIEGPGRAVATLKAAQEVLGSLHDLVTLKSMLLSTMDLPADSDAAATSALAGIERRIASLSREFEANHRIPLLGCAGRLSGRVGIVAACPTEFNRKDAPTNPNVRPAV